ncbi:TPA: methyltransferase [Candidatus Woesearchaeota archaeon]|nr:methyltransferase [Candidatus Woesearchaeota archaeon]HIH47480.1 methyltransferase [Candidatus Woesearchaeota archaeon]HII88912.1 methyltransferase [Candidatus Woesearchaeota archaeon]
MAKTYDESVYEPREDSLLLAKSIALFARGNVLDMGTGSGIQAITAAQQKNVDTVLAVDVNKQALAYAKEQNKSSKITYQYSDLFQAIPRQLFDTIIFNPPYLPNDTNSHVQNIALDGGKKGYELIERFMEQASNSLKEDGIILLLFSSLTHQTKVNEIIKKQGFTHAQVDEQKIAFETLYVYKITKDPFVVHLNKKGIQNVQRFTQGKRGIIYTGWYHGKKVAIKQQKRETKTHTLMNEVATLRKLRCYKIGQPVLFAEQADGEQPFTYFVYPFAEGQFVLEFLQDTRTTPKDVKNFVQQLFKTMRQLDKLHINKEEMHHPLKHILVQRKKRGLEIVLLDFERARYEQKPHNVSQFCEFLCRARAILQKKGLQVSIQKLRSAAQRYKGEQTEANMKKITELAIHP